MTARSVETKIGHVFADKTLLRTALTHGSYSNLHGGESYERMEYLGDALLDFVIAEELYRRFPNADEGELTRRRVALVSEQPLAAASRRLGLDNEIRVIPQHMGKDSVMSDVFESMTAAIYLDGGLEAARRFVLGALGGEMDCDDTEDTDEKSALYEKFGQDGVRFVEENRTGPAHRPSFTMALYVNGQFAARATGSSKKEAEKECAHEFFRNFAPNPKGEL